jgi:hypothetical protein
LQVVLDLVVIHVQEGWLYGVTPEEVAAHEEALRAAVVATGCPVPLQCIPLQAALHVGQGESQEADQLQQLKQMYQVLYRYAWPDATPQLLGFHRLVLS